VYNITEQALILAAAGLPVFPCALKGVDKQPVCAGGHKAATTDPDRIKTLFAHRAANIIGVPMGPLSGLIAMDFDPRHGGDIWFAEHAAEFPPTRTHRTLQGGTHLLFLDGGHGLRNRAGIAPGVDVRGAGGWIVFPPSQGYSVIDPAPYAAMPPGLVTFCAAPRGPPTAPPTLPGRALAVTVPPWRYEATAPLAAPYGPGEPGHSGGGSRYGEAALFDEARLIRQAYDGQKHDVINKAAYSIGGLVAAGELSQGYALAILLDAVASLRGRCRDYGHALMTVHKGMAEGIAKRRYVLQIPLLPTDTAAADYLIAALKAKEAAAGAAAMPPVQALPVPLAIMQLDGALKLFVDYCAETAIYPQPFITLGAAICLIGALAGRKYRTETDLRTNFYIVGVADSSGGKDHPRKRAKAALVTAGLTRFLGGEELASGSSILAAVNRHPCALFQIDEFGDFLADVLGERSPPHKKSIAQLLKKMFSSAGGFVSGTEYADQTARGRPRQDIHDPHVCLFGTSTPYQFWNVFGNVSIEDGFLARMLVFVSTLNYPPPRKPVMADPPPQLIAMLQAIIMGAEPHGNFSGVMVAGVATEPHIVPMTAEAAAAFEDLKMVQHARLKAAEGTPKTAIIGRLTENATKLALVRAVSFNPAAPVITGEYMAWGRALAEHCIRTLLREAEENIADTLYGKNKQTLLKLIKKLGNPTEAELVRKGKWELSEKDRAALLGDLARTGEIVATQKPPGPAGGRPTIRYALSNTENESHD
jgi:hypothetical protein